MIKSMTGFGRGVYGDEKRNIIAEVRSVNHRYCDVTIKLPRKYGFAEEDLKAQVKEIAKRGKIDVFISVENLSDEEMSLKLNFPLAKTYHDSLLELKTELGLDEEITLKAITDMPDVMKIIPKVEDEEEILNALKKPMADALALFDEMRIREGNNIKVDIMERGKIIRDICKEIAGKEPSLIAQYKEKLEERIKQLLESQAVIPEDRIILEAAIFADKSNITEELVRMESHLAQLKAMVEGYSEDSAGKKLDFLIQEMNREVNTIGSKANDIGITNHVLKMKSEIEKIREQVQNIE